MAADLDVWDPSFGPEPLSTDFFDWIDEMVMAEPSPPPASSIRGFVAVLLERYPDLTNQPDGGKTIWTFGPLLAGAHGGLITLALTWDGYASGGAFILDAARRSGLNVYDPQEDRFHMHDGRVLSR